MEIFKNIKFNQKVQLITVPLLILFIAASGIVFCIVFNRNVLKSTQHQTEVYIDKLIQIFDITEKQTGNGYTNADYNSIKQYFQTPAFLETDYPLLASKNGCYLIHILREGQMLPIEIITSFKNPKNKVGKLIYSDFDNNKTQKRILFYKYYEPYKAYVAVSVNPKEAIQNATNFRTIIIIMAVLFIALTYLVVNLVLNPLSKKINLIKNNIGNLSTGIIPNPINDNSHDEIGSIIENLNSYTENLKSTTNFAKNIANNNLNTDYQSLSSNDLLGNSLLYLRNNLINSQKEEIKRKNEEDIRAWSNLGLAKFADILRQNNNDLSALGDSIIQNLVNYLEANQGGIFLSKETGDENLLELLSAFAYNRKKYIQKTIQFGEGLVGTCALEKQTIFLKEIPNDYITITSGLGEATPTCLLITPLKLEDEIFGVIEIASFHEFAPHEIEFVEKVGISIASTLSSAQNNIRTKFLLEQSQQQREEMSAQEEEMRQNMEEMQATQEEMSRKQVELEGITNAINQGLEFMLLNDEGVIIESNHNALNLLGLTKLEVEGKPLLDFVSRDQKNDIKQVWENVQNGESTDVSLHLKGNNDKEIFMQTTIAPCVDEMGGITKIFLIGKDITNTKNLEIKVQKQAEEIALNLKNIQATQELKSAQEKEKLDILNAFDQYCLISIIETSGLISFINNKNVEILGDTKEQIEGKYLQDIDYSAKHEPEKFRNMWNNLMEGKQQQRIFTLNVNNKQIWIRENYTPILDDNGKPIKIINIGFDISESKEIEIKLEALQSEILKLKDTNKNG